MSTLIYCLHTCTCTLDICTMKTYCSLHELLYPLQGGFAPLHFAAKVGRTTCVERLLSTPGIDVNIKNEVNVHVY